MKLDRVPYMHIGGVKKVCGTAGVKARATTKLDQVTCPNCVAVYLNYLEQPDAPSRGSADVT